MLDLNREAEILNLNFSLFFWQTTSIGVSKEVGNGRELLYGNL